MFFGNLKLSERWKVKGGLILHFEKKWRGKYTLYTRIMDSTFDFWNIQVALRMIEEAWKPKTFVSTLKVHCDVVGHTVSTHSQECARLIHQARLAREGGRWLAFQDGQLMTQWSHQMGVLCSLAWPWDDFRFLERKPHHVEMLLSNCSLCVQFSGSSPSCQEPTFSGWTHTGTTLAIRQEMTRVKQVNLPRLFLFFCKYLRFHLL